MYERGRTDCGAGDEQLHPGHSPPEWARLAAIRALGLADRTGLDDLDKVARLAAARFGRPMAGVCFVEESNLWFGGMVGLPGRRTPRLGSPCDAALWHDTPFCVPDARADPRFAAHPLVSGPAGVRAYAGAALLYDDDHRLGTVCVFDTEPGPAPVELLDELATLARLTRRLLATVRSVPEPARPRMQGWLGVRTVGDAGKPGLIVLGVASGSPAAQAGIRPTDILYAIDQWTLCRPGDVVAALSDREEGEMVPVRIGRLGGTLECFVRIEPRAARGLRSRAISAPGTGSSVRLRPRRP